MIDDMNAKNELMELVKGEKIEAITIEDEGSSFQNKSHTFYPKHMVGEAMKVLDKNFDGGYGGEEGPTFYAWTKSKVVFKSVYDGSESYIDIPRNPEDVCPSSYGGG